MKLNNNIKFELIKKISNFKFKYRNLEKISRIDSNSPPSVFIGSGLKYPKVNVGILSPLERDEEAWIYDDARFWAENNLKISDVIKIRSSLLNSRFQTEVKNARAKNKFLEIAKEIALSSKPVDIEVKLSKVSKENLKQDNVSAPHGLKASLKDAKITGNPKISRKVEKIVNDEVKASEGIFYLYKSNVNEYSLSKILSIGVFGMKKDKRLVPTRWAITATDDILAKRILEEVKKFRVIENCELFFGEFLGNCYLVLFLPDIFRYELFEIYLPGSSWNTSKGIKASTDYEDYNGRKRYAFSTAGGYYAARLPIVERLFKIKRQASVFALRIELPEYWASLGVWVVREAMRKTLSNRKIEFSDSSEAIKSLIKISKIKFGFDALQIAEKSKIFSLFKNQKRLSEWLS